jgi:fructose-1,6-bisphosphatase II / sedoheptulose-1,7-bisphosphatase
LGDRISSERGIVDRFLAQDLVRVTERAAVSAARWRGRGDERAADRAAAEAMRRELNRLPIDGTVVIGESEHDEAPVLFIGERVGTGQGPALDIAVDPLEGTTLCAKDLPGSIAVLAVAQAGALLKAPDVYMDKIAVGPGYPAGIVDLDRSPEENIAALAAAKAVRPADITVSVLDRPRHAELIAACRRAGASLRLLTDGDIAGIIMTAQPGETRVDLHLGSGGAPEGVLAAGALRCVGGQMQGRLILDTPEKAQLAAGVGITDPGRKYDMVEMAAGEVVVVASGVTDGAMLRGVKFGAATIETETVIYRSSSGSVRRIRAEHRDLAKFRLG